MSGRVLDVVVERVELSGGAPARLRAMFGIERLPLAPARVEMTLDGVPTAVVNAIRRVVVDEMPGLCLQAPPIGAVRADGAPTGWDYDATTEKFMLPHFVLQRLAAVPLTVQIPPEQVRDLRWDLDVTNRTTGVLSVYTGDLVVVAGAMPEPLFNPCFILADLQPGCRLCVRGIFIQTGYGRDNSAFQVARCAAFTHLDIEQWPRADTHSRDGAQADLSGYRESSLVADPRRHRLRAVVPAAGPDPAGVRAVFADACANVVARLRLVLNAAVVAGDTGAASAANATGASLLRIPLEQGLVEAVLLLPGETHTVGGLLRRAVFDLVPEISNVAYTIAPHENCLRLSIRSQDRDPVSVLHEATRGLITCFEQLRVDMIKA